MENHFIENINCSIHCNGGSSSQLKAYYRFLHNSKVSEPEIKSSINEFCNESSKDKSVLVYCDTTTVNLSRHKNRIRDTEGLGLIGRNERAEFLGLNVHALLVHDKENGTPLGLADVRLLGPPIKTKNEKSSTWRSKTPIEGKQSYKWLGSVTESLNVSLRDAKHAIFIMDREADIIDIFDRVKTNRSDVVIRSSHNRNVLGSDGEKIKLVNLLLNSKPKGGIELKIEGNSKRKNRIAKMEIRYVTCKLCWSKTQKHTKKINEEGVSVSVIEIKEKSHRGYKNEKPLIWRLITTLEVENLEQAIEIINYYKKRWNIEEYFKLLKTDGYNIESTELTTGPAIRKQILFIMKASIKVLQLKAARDGDGDLKLTDVFSREEIICLEKLNPELEGNTELQRNPFDKEYLSWASWIIARLGGWKEFYDKSRPPGNKTFKWGLDKFESIVYSYRIFKN